MMDSLRSATNHIAFKIIFSIIILSFVFTGFSGFLMPSLSGDYAVKVNDEKISKRAIAQDVNYFRNETPKNPDESNEDYIKRISRLAIDRVVDITLLQQFIDKNGVVISDEDVMENIRKNKEFYNKEGKFDNDNYLRVLEESKMPPEVYAYLLKSSLAHQQAEVAIFTTDFLLPHEVEFLSKLNQKRSIYLDKLTISESYRNAPEFSEDEIKKYYKDHLSEFNTEGMAKFGVIGITNVELEKRVTVSDEEIEKYYTEHSDEYLSVEQKRFSVIRVNDEKIAQEILMQLKKNVKFEDLAEKYSIYPSLAKNGGDIGLYTVDKEMPKELANLPMKNEGETSDIIKIDSDFAIFKLTQHIKPNLLSVDEAKDEIAEILKKEKTYELFENLEKQTSQLAKQNPSSLEPIEKLLDKKIVETPLTEMKNERFSYFSYRQLEDEAKQLYQNYKKVGINSEPVYFKDKEGIEHFYIMRIDDYVPAGTKSFEIVKDDALQKMKLSWAKNQTQEKAKAIVTDLNAGKTELLEKEGLSFAKKIQLSRNSKDYPSEIIEKIFLEKLPEGNNKQVNGFVENKDKTEIVIYALVGIEDQQEMSEAELQAALQNLIINNQKNFIESLKKDSKITLSPEFR